MRKHGEGVLYGTNVGAAGGARPPLPPDTPVRMGWLPHATLDKWFDRAVSAFVWLIAMGLVFATVVAANWASAPVRFKPLAESDMLSVQCQVRKDERHLCDEIMAYMQARTGAFNASVKASGDPAPGGVITTAPIALDANGSIGAALGAK